MDGEIETSSLAFDEDKTIFVAFGDSTFSVSFFLGFSTSTFSGMLTVFSTSSGFSFSISGSLSDEECDALVALDDEDELDDEDVDEELEDDKVDNRRCFVEDEGVIPDRFSLKGKISCVINLESIFKGQNKQS